MFKRVMTLKELLKTTENRGIVLHVSGDDEKTSRLISGGDSVKFSRFSVREFDNTNYISVYVEGKWASLFELSQDFRSMESVYKRIK